MTPTEIYAIVAAGSIVLGWTLRGARSSFGIHKDVNGLTKEVAEFKKHTGDTDKHIVKGREDLMVKMLTDNFASLHVKVDLINSRCEGRLIACQGRFSGLDKKVAVMSAEDKGE